MPYLLMRAAPRLSRSDAPMLRDMALARAVARCRHHDATPCLLQRLFSPFICLF